MDGRFILLQPVVSHGPVLAQIDRYITGRVNLISFYLEVGYAVTLSYYSQWYHTVPYWHKSIGILLAGLTLFRFIWKLVTPSPSVEGKPLERIAANIVHKLIYVNLAVIFISGYLISTADGRGISVFDWFTVPSLGSLFPRQTDISGDVHFYAAWFLIIMVSIHALAALKHHFIDKDNTLRKMTGAKK
ncbi:cytochrome b561 [Vibrio metschnikovii]|uniref:cytochrome b n=1 Tax=Vibrio metschnikovii TaxID=28172 RepID=UPI000E01360D|nr:cytochrome b561 [Vibrio metschnikovii]